MIVRERLRPLRLVVGIFICLLRRPKQHRINQDCVLDIFSVGFLIDFILIVMVNVCMFTGINWLSRCRAVINCEKQLVMIRDPSRGLITIYGEGTRVGSAFCSTARVRQCLCHGCNGYLAFVVDLRVDGKLTVSDIPIVREFPNVSPRDFPGVAPER